MGIVESEFSKACPFCIACTILDINDMTISSLSEVSGPKSLLHTCSHAAVPVPGKLWLSWLSIICVVCSLIVRPPLFARANHKVKSGKL